MDNVLWALTVVIGIAALEIWSVLKDIREALQAISGGIHLSDGKLDAVAGKLGGIDDYLGAIWADMPTPPPKPEPRPYWQTSWSVSKGKVSEENSQLDGFKVVDRRSFAADGSRNVPNEGERGAR